MLLYFLERRELGVINIGGPGFIEIDGEKEEMKKQDGYYIGKETEHVVFSSVDPKPCKVLHQFCAKDITNIQM